MPVEILKIQNQQVTIKDTPQEEDIFVYAEGVYLTEGRDYTRDGKTFKLIKPNSLAGDRDATPDGEQLTIKYKIDKADEIAQRIKQAVEEVEKTFKDGFDKALKRAREDWELEKGQPDSPEVEKKKSFWDLSKWF